METQEKQNFTVAHDGKELAMISPYIHLHRIDHSPIVMTNDKKGMPFLRATISAIPRLAVNRIGFRYYRDDSYIGGSDSFNNLGILYCSICGLWGL